MFIDRDQWRFKVPYLTNVTAPNIKLILLIAIRQFHVGCMLSCQGTIIQATITIIMINTGQLDMAASRLHPRQPDKIA